MEEGKLKDQTQISVLKILGDYRELKDITGIDLATLLKFLTAKTCFGRGGTGAQPRKYVIYGVSKEGVLAVPAQGPNCYLLCVFRYEDCGGSWALSKEELL